MRIPRIRFIAALAVGTAVALGAVAAFTPPPNDPDFAPDPACPPGGPAIPMPAVPEPVGPVEPAQLLVQQPARSRPRERHLGRPRVERHRRAARHGRRRARQRRQLRPRRSAPTRSGSPAASCRRPNAAGNSVPGSSPGCREPGLVYDLQRRRLLRTSRTTPATRASRTPSPPRRRRAATCACSRTASTTTATASSTTSRAATRATATATSTAPPATATAPAATASSAPRPNNGIGIAGVCPRVQPRQRARRRAPS